VPGAAADRPGLSSESSAAGALTGSCPIDSFRTEALDFLDGVLCEVGQDEQKAIRRGRRGDSQRIARSPAPMHKDLILPAVHRLQRAIPSLDLCAIRCKEGSSCK
jgi:hypothetical protein